MGSCLSHEETLELVHGEDCIYIDIPSFVRKDAPELLKSMLMQLMQI